MTEEYAAVSKEYLTDLKGYFTESREELARVSEEYLKGIVDFVKWTSTAATASMLWIGNNTGSITCPPQRIAAVAALVFLMVSLSIAILTVKRALDEWKREWDYANANALFFAILHLKAIIPYELLTPQVMASLEQERLEAFESLDKASRAAQPTSQFNAWLVLHMIFLLIGILLYVSAQAVAL
jgi:hypothetical protein